MGRQILFFICMILFISTVSADIILGQTKSLYNLGDQFSVQSTVKTTEKVTDFFQMYLLCDSRQTEFYREYLILERGGEKKAEPSIILYKNIIGDSSGICRIKATFKGEYILSDDFKISNKLKINGSLDKL